MAERAKRPYKPPVRRVAPAPRATLGSEEKINLANGLASTQRGTNMTSLDSFRCARPLKVACNQLYKMPNQSGDVAGTPVG